MHTNQLYVNDGEFDTCVASLSVTGLCANLPVSHYVYPLYIQWGSFWTSPNPLEDLVGPDVARIVCQYGRASVSLLPFWNIASPQPRSWLDASLVFSEAYRVQELRVQTCMASHLPSPQVFVRFAETLAQDQPPQLRVDAGQRIGVDIEVEACACAAVGHALVTMYLVPA